MSLSNDQITAKNFKAFYEVIRPYLNGAAHSGFTPIGTVISVMGNSAPLNYLVCDGTVYNIADYPELAQYFYQQFEASNYFGGDGTTTFAVPDLRGEFLRGTGTNSHTGQGSGEDVGTHQDGTELPYIFGATSSYSVAVGRKGAISNADAVGDSAKQTNVSGSQSSSSYNTFVVPRPTNTSVLYCIATKNIFVDAGSNYSTDEIVIGTWIDGKPIYQKTLKFKSSATSGQVANANIGASVDYIQLVSAVVDNGWGNFVPLSTMSVDATKSGVIGMRNHAHATAPNTITFTTTIDTWLDQWVHATIQYTKTTD